MASRLAIMLSDCGACLQLKPLTGICECPNSPLKCPRSAILRGGLCALWTVKWAQLHGNLDRACHLTSCATRTLPECSPLTPQGQQFEDNIPECDQDTILTSCKELRKIQMSQCGRSRCSGFSDVRVTALLEVPISWHQSPCKPSI